MDGSVDSRKEMISTDEEEFDLNEGFVEPHSIILKTPIKRKRL